mgnify:CR=1 FL=1|jgi:predicted RNase H-like nuclease (RuvC/YqgF family)
MIITCQNKKQKCDWQGKVEHQHKHLHNGCLPLQHVAKCQENTTLKEENTTLKEENTTLKDEVTTMKDEVTTMKDEVRMIKGWIRYKRQREARANPTPDNTQRPWRMPRTTPNMEKNASAWLSRQ